MVIAMHYLVLGVNDNVIWPNNLFHYCSVHDDVLVLYSLFYFTL